MSRILTLLVFVVFALHQAESSGVFELRLISFDNEAGKDDLGKCCSGISGTNSECEGMCRPRFRVCLKEYQVKIDTTSPCTFGDVITTELEPNPGSDTPQNGFENSIALPFPFTWPGTFSLIVEAWHGNQTSHPAGESMILRSKFFSTSSSRGACVCAI
jgi:delta-like protein